jgi:exodeoxyribonuclease V alpha subunit
VVGRPGEFRPLILDHRGRLYLYRYWDYEQRLAQDLLSRVNDDPTEVDEERLRAELTRFFPQGTGRDLTDWQKVAATVAVLKRFCVISGGPGTGKTSAVVRLLALLVRQPNGRRPRIALVAPTGKAAARLQETVRLTKWQLGLSETETIPEDVTTIHRLLGARSNSVYFRHDRINPLPLDVLVVDEASMVDLALMAKLVAALPPQARLILLGDKDQLASVEAGAVLGDICGGVPGFSENWRRRLEELSGEVIPAGKAVASPLGEAIVLLKHSYRFAEQSGIAKLAQAVNQGQGERALALLEAGGFPDLVWQSLVSPRELRERLTASLIRGYRPYLEKVKANAEPDQVFAAFNHFRLLCAQREGVAGVEELNRLSEAVLQSRSLITPRPTWYPGRPVMITRNDYDLRLFNGDIGIALSDPNADGRLRVFFQTTAGRWRGFPPSRLPEHETVYAMTIHKSQGSEFNHVLMVLPLETSPVLTRELIYTGISRARQMVELWANPRVFKSAVVLGLKRSSGLREALWGDQG